jgi:general secretion pathway protein K
MKSSQKGIALLIVLWVMMILMVTVFSFSVMTRAETYGTLAFKEGVEKKFLAEAGIERGIMEMIYRSVNQNQTVTLVGKEVWKLDGTAYTVDMGGSGYVIRIIDDSGKISLNSLTDASGIIVKNLLINQGVSPENADIIIDSILDWKDADDLHRLNGAESDYYLSLPNPYKARNTPFETLEMLILVKGVTSEILYGTDKKKGIIHFLTLYSTMSQININAAPKEILAALPGMTAETADRIMELRALAEIRGIDDIKDIIGSSYSQMAPYVSFAPGSTSAAYTVEATGYKGDQKKGYSIRATVTFDSLQQYRYVYYKCPVETIQ